MNRKTLSLFGAAKPAPIQKRPMNDDPLAGLTPVERAMAQRLSPARG